MTYSKIVSGVGGSRTDKVCIYVPAFLGAFFEKFGIVIDVGFHPRRRSPKFLKIGCIYEQMIVKNIRFE